MNPIRVEKLTKSFRSKSKIVTAVNHISFELGEGEVLGFLGPNGAGKTTTIQMLLSTLTPSSGKIFYFGKDFEKCRSEVLQYISFASSYTCLPWRLTVSENLDVYGRLYGLAAGKRKERAKSLLQYFDAWDLRDKTISKLSAGQLTRVMLAKAFLAEPKVALLDEPTASLDPDIAHEVRAFVRTQQREFGTAILYTSHNMDEVAEVCDRVIFLKKGNIVACDTPDHLASQLSATQVWLDVVEGMECLLSLLQGKQIHFERTENRVVISLPEQEVASLLASITRNSVEYARVHIEKPTLEKYFLHIAKEAA